MNALTFPSSGTPDLQSLLKECKRDGVFSRGYGQILGIQAEIQRIVTEAEVRRRPVEYLGRYRDAQDSLRHAVRRFLALEPQNDAEIAFASPVAKWLSG